MYRIDFHPGDQDYECCSTVSFDGCIEGMLYWDDADWTEAFDYIISCMPHQREVR